MAPQLLHHSLGSPARFFVGSAGRIGRMIVACLVWWGIENRCSKLDGCGLVARWKPLLPHYLDVLALLLSWSFLPSQFRRFIRCSAALPTHWVCTHKLLSAKLISLSNLGPLCLIAGCIFFSHGGGGGWRSSGEIVLFESWGRRE